VKSKKAKKEKHDPAPDCSRQVSGGEKEKRITKSA